MSRIRFTTSAEADLLELWLTIAEENIVAADESLDSIQATVSLLGSQPELADRAQNWRLSCAASRRVPRTLFSI
jgi:plasmid stabilization system protein ParE